MSKVISKFSDYILLGCDIIQKFGTGFNMSKSTYFKPNLIYADIRFEPNPFSKISRTRITLIWKKCKFFSIVNFYHNKIGAEAPIPLLLTFFRNKIWFFKIINRF